MSVDDKPFSSGEVEKLLAEYDGGGSIASLANLAPRLARAYLALLSENQMLKGCNGNSASESGDGSAPVDALRAILTAVRGDEKSECWTLRKWLDDHDVFNDDIQGRIRLIELACKLALPEELQNAE